VTQPEPRQIIVKQSNVNEGCGCGSIIGLIVVLAILGSIFGGGGGGGNTNNSERENIPQYSAKKVKEGDNGGQAVALYTVTTRAGSEDDLRAIVKDLRAKNPDPDGLAVFFKPKGGDFFGSGYAFEDAETETVFMDSTDTDPAEWEAGKEGDTSILLD